MHRLGRVGRGTESTIGGRDRQGRGDAPNNADKVRLGDLNVSKISVDKKHDEGKDGGLKAPGNIFEIDRKTTPPMRFVLMKSNGQPHHGRSAGGGGPPPMAGVLDLEPAAGILPLQLFHIVRAGTDKEDQ